MSSIRIHAGRVECPECHEIIVGSRLKKHQGNRACRERRDRLNRAPVKIEHAYALCQCGLMIVSDSLERKKHTNSQHHFKTKAWQERLKNAKLYRCICGFFVISCYHKKHEQTEEHKENVSRRRQMKMEIKRMECGALQGERKYVSVVKSAPQQPGQHDYKESSQNAEENGRELNEYIEAEAMEEENVGMDINEGQDLASNPSIFCETFQQFSTLKVIVDTEVKYGTDEYGNTIEQTLESKEFWWMLMDIPRNRLKNLWDKGFNVDQGGQLYEPDGTPCNYAPKM